METGTIEVLKAHVALNVSDVERSIDFYTKMLGIDPCKVRTGYAKFDVAVPPLNLTLNQNPATVRGALSHMGIQVESTEDGSRDAGALARTRSLHPERNGHELLLCDPG